MPIMKTAIPARALPCVIAFCLVIFGQGNAPAQTTDTCVSPLNADFFSKYEVIEGAAYVETNAAGTVLSGSNAFAFAAEIILSTNLSASSAVVMLPGQGPTLMKMTDSRHFILGGATNSFTNLTSAFPDGAYEFVVLDNNIEVTLPPGSALPNPPALASYSADQSIDATKNFTLSWNPFNTGGVLDFISVSVTAELTGSNAFKSQPFGCPGALDGTAASILIPSNTLASNTTYRAEIDFIKVYTFDTNSIPGDALLAGTEADTQATIATGPVLQAASLLVLTNAASLSGGGVRFDLTTTPGVTYTVQFNKDLNNPAGWMPLLVTNAVANLVPFTNGPPVGAAAGYYRAVHQ